MPSIVDIICHRPRLNKTILDTVLSQSLIYLYNFNWVFDSFSLVEILTLDGYKNSALITFSVLQIFFRYVYNWFLTEHFSVGVSVLVIDLRDDSFLFFRLSDYFRKHLESSTNLVKNDGSFLFVEDFECKFPYKARSSHLTHSVRYTFRQKSYSTLILDCKIYMDRRWCILSIRRNIPNNIDFFTLNALSTHIIDLFTCNFDYFFTHRFLYTITTYSNRETKATQLPLRDVYLYIIFWMISQ